MSVLVAMLCDKLPPKLSGLKTRTILLYFEILFVKNWAGVSWVTALLYLALMEMTPSKITCGVQLVGGLD